MLSESATDHVLEELDDATLSLVIHLLPKVETHRHLEAGCSLERFLEVALKYGVPLPISDFESLRAHVQIGSHCHSLTEFLKKFAFIQQIFISRAAIEDLTFLTIRDAAAENLKHLELRFAPACMAEHHKLDLHDVMRGVIDGTSRACAQADISISLIVITERHRGVAHAHAIKELALAYRNAGVCAFDLAGNEQDFPPAPFAQAFQEARARGLAITAHAGEAAGPENVRTVIEQFGAVRVGHAARILSDPEVVDLIRTRNIHIESCPECNVRIGATSGGYENHPLPKFLELGLNVGINTDDPLILGTTPSSERILAVRKLKLGFNQLRILDLNSARASFLPETQKTQLVTQIRKGYEDVCERLINRTIRVPN